MLFSKSQFLCTWRERHCNSPEMEDFQMVPRKEVKDPTQLSASRSRFYPRSIGHNGDCWSLFWPGTVLRWWIQAKSLHCGPLRFRLAAWFPSPPVCRERLGGLTRYSASVRKHKSVSETLFICFLLDFQPRQDWNQSGNLQKQTSIKYQKRGVRRGTISAWEFARWWGKLTPPPLLIHKCHGGY